MTARPTATIHLSNIAANWRVFDRTARGDAGAVVKANAYGHGAGPVAKALAGAGCRSFFVAYAFEGAEIRAALGEGPDIYVFNGSLEADYSVCRSAKLIPVLNALADIAAWTGQGADVPAALHIDTGMNRLGVRADRLGEAKAALGSSTPILLMSHFACADTPDHPMNAAQIAAFDAARAVFPRVRTSLANSAGHWLGPDAHGDLTRPGIGLYGGGTNPLRSAELKPGMTLTAPILQVSNVPSGETIGYGATARLDTPRTLATLALGYGDGFLRSASNSGFAMLEGIRCPILGRVSMDLITIDVSSAQGLAKPGVMTELIGPNADLEAQAAAAGTLGYELVTGLGARVERIHTN